MFTQTPENKEKKERKNLKQIYGGSDDGGFIADPPPGFEPTQPRWEVYIGNGEILHNYGELYPKIMNIFGLRKDLLVQESVRSVTPDRENDPNCYTFVRED